MGSNYDVIILGSGPAGLTAALYAARARLTTLITGGRPGGKPIMYEHIGNFPGFPDGVTGAQLMMGMLKQVMDLGVERVTENASSVALEGPKARVIAADDEFSGRALIVATGSDPIPLDVAGAAQLEGRGVFYCAHCDAPVFKAMEKTRAAVFGGGDSALYTAMYLTRYAEEVTIIYRGDQLRADKTVQEAATSHPKVRVRLGQEITRIITEGDRLRAIMLRDRTTGEQVEFGTDGLFVGIGQKPNSELFKGILALDEEGFILVNNRMETSVPSLFAAGDVIQKPLRQIVTAAGDGAVAADSAIKYLEGRR
jgi:thioredoxin reductase (NADPH)